MRLVLVLAVLAIASAADLPRGRILDDIKCATDSSQSYALYVPSNYSSDRSWSLILAYDPAARGHLAVSRFAAAAEEYGYLVAGSNNSRNGDWQASSGAIRAVSADVAARFSIDLKRVYAAGFSGGARVAMQLAMASGKIAGVIASSAGFPDAQARKSVPFVIFGTAGTDDFNFQEMRRLDDALQTPHRVVIFEGGHDWLPEKLAREALAWLELHAMKSGLRPRDDTLVEKSFQARLTEADGITDPQEKWRALKSISADFDGLKDVAEISGRAEALGREKSVKDELKKERSIEQREEQMTQELVALENNLGNQAKREESLMELRDRLSDLSRRGRAKDDSAERRLARRVLRGAVVRSFEHVKDEEYRKLLDELH